MHEDYLLTNPEEETLYETVKKYIPREVLLWISYEAALEMGKIIMEAEKDANGV